MLGRHRTRRASARPDRSATSDAAVRALLAGDADAFEAFWRAVHPLVLRYARVVAPDAAEDVAAEAWTTVLQGLDRFSGGADDLRGWVFTCARRRALDHHRRARRRPTAPLHAVAEPPGGPEPAVVHEAELGTAEALALLARLPPDQAEVVALRVLGGFSVDEVATIVGRPPGTVRVMAHRGLRRLEQLVEPAPDRL
jgi:RNA polymerase sigma-70 factor (ECF subfamily)